MRRLLTLATLISCALDPAAAVVAQEPQLTVTSPSAGALIRGTSVTVSFETAGITLARSPVPLEEAGRRPEANRPGEGHLHFMLDLQPLVVWEQGDPYTFTNVPPGEHELMAELVNNDHSSLSPPVTRVIRFRSVAGETAPAALPTAGVAAPPSYVLLVFVAISLIVGGLILRRRRV